MVHEIKTKQEFDETINSGKVVLVDFYASWCGPCRMISPAFEKHESEYEAEDIAFYKVNIDNVPDVAAELGIQSIPLFHVFKGGKSIDKLVGADRMKLTTLVQTAIKNTLPEETTTQ